MVVAVTVHTNYKTRCKSAPLQRRRTLDEFSMDYTRGEISSMANYWRNQRIRKADTVSKVCVESENLRQYSRRRFDYVIKSAKAGLPSSSRKISCDQLPTQTYNGPSRRGSPLYNKTASVLNNIRLRPSSHSATFEHESTAYPDIKRTLSQSNCNYTVTCTQSQVDGCVTPNRSVTSEYVLIPQSSSAKSVHDNIYFWTDSNDCTYEQDRIEANMCSATKRQSKACTSEYLSSTSSSSSASPEPTNTPLTPGSKDLLELQEYIDGSKSEVIPVIKQGHKLGELPKPVKKYRNSRPKCWVDDVTISSDQSVRSRAAEVENEVENVETPEQQLVDGIESHPTLPVPVSSPLSGTDLRDDRAADGPTNTDPVVQDLNIMSLDDLKGHKLELPKFLCPSSETKSRQVAIKDWLIKTRFTSANRQIPLF